MKEDDLKNFLLILFGAIAFWDAATTFIGSYEILGTSKDIAIGFSIGFAVIILALMISTTSIWSVQGGFGFILKPIWIIAFIFDIYTSYTGNLDIVLGGEANGKQFILLAGMTLLTTSAPILFSLFLIKNFNSWEIQTIL